MAAKKKTKKKIVKAKKTTLRKTSPKKKVAKKKASARKGTSKTKLAKKKLAVKKITAKAPKKRVRPREQVENGLTSASTNMRSGRQSGDLQGLSRGQGADSESVNELLEEGNTFEAGVIEGVENADDDQTQEVRTRQFPEDDVPGEYLDED